MMKIIVNFMVGILALALILFVIFFLSRSYILQTGEPKVLQILLQGIAPPNDYYQYLVNKDIDVSKEGSATKLQFKNKYTGRYFVGVLLGKFNQELYGTDKPATTLKISMECSENGKLILSRISDEYSPFISKEGGGLILMTYQAGKDLPVGKEIACVIKIIRADSILNNYGPVKIFIKKMSDK